MQILPSFIKTTFFPSPADNLSKQFVSAIDRNDVEAIRALEIDFNAPLSTEEGDLPIVYAVKQNKFKAVVALMSKGANPTISDHHKLTAIQYSLLTQNKEMVALLFNWITDLDLTAAKNTLSNPTTSHEAVYSALLDIAKREPTKIPEEISSEEAIPLSHKEGTSLHDYVIFAAKKGRKLEINDPNVSNVINQVDDKGRTPLHYAAAYCRLDLIRLLCAHGADIHAKDANGITPLELVLGWCHFQTDGKNPLDVKISESLPFVISAMLWTTNLFLLKHLPWDVVQGLNRMGQCAQHFQYWNSFSTWKGFFVSALTDAAMWYFLPETGIARMAYDTFTIGKVAFSAIEGAISCWKNRSLGKMKAFTKAAVTTLPKFASVAQWVNRVGAASGLWKKSTIDKVLEESKKICPQKDYYLTSCENSVKDVIVHCEENQSSSSCLDARASLTREWMRLPKECDGFMPYYMCRKQADVVTSECLETSPNCKNVREVFQRMLDNKDFYKRASQECQDIPDWFEFGGGRILNVQDRCINKKVAVLVACDRDSISPECSQATDNMEEYARRINYLRNYRKCDDVFKKWNQVCNAKINHLEDACYNDLESPECGTALKEYETYIEGALAAKQQCFTISSIFQDTCEKYAELAFRTCDLMGPESSSCKLTTETVDDYVKLALKFEQQPSCASSKIYYLECEDNELKFKFLCQKDLESPKCSAAWKDFDEFLKKATSKKSSSSGRQKNSSSAHQGAIPSDFCKQPQFKDSNPNIALAKCLAVIDPNQYNGAEDDNPSIFQKFKGSEKQKVARFIIKQGVEGNGDISNKQTCIKAGRKLQSKVHPDLLSDQLLAQQATANVNWAKEKCGNL